LIFGEKRTEITDISKDLFSIYFLIFLIMDSFYTTYNLVNDLFKKQVYVIGAVRSNSSAMPTFFLEKKMDERKLQVEEISDGTGKTNL
jgi:hypothetical protein